MNLKYIKDNKLKVVLVTSRITYCPYNYNQTLKLILKNSNHHISGIIIIKNNYFDIIKFIPLLYILKCKTFTNILIKNIISSLKKEKEHIVEKYNIPIFYTKNINENKITNWLKKQNIDLILNMRARNIFKKNILLIPRFGCLNIHHGILPSQQGLFCDLYALAEKKETGFSIHSMTTNIDQGAVYLLNKIEHNDNYINYLKVSGLEEGKVVSDLITKISENNSLPQTHISKPKKIYKTTTPSISDIIKLKKQGIIL